MFLTNLYSTAIYLKLPDWVISLFTKIVLSGNIQNLKIKIVKNLGVYGRVVSSQVVIDVMDFLNLNVHR